MEEVAVHLLVRGAQEAVNALAERIRQPIFGHQLACVALDGRLLGGSADPISRSVFVLGRCGMRLERGRRGEGGKG